MTNNANFLCRAKDVINFLALKVLFLDFLSLSPSFYCCHGESLLEPKERSSETSNHSYLRNACVIRLHFDSVANCLSMVISKRVLIPCAITTVN